MSRLDSAIRRLEAQRDCLDAAARLIAEVPGPILELGLGNGRTYDHLRGLFPERDIFVFDRRVAAHPDCIPDDEHLFLGDMAETLPLAAARLGRSAALAHADLGSGRPEPDARLAGQVGPLLALLVRPEGVVLSDQPFSGGAWVELPQPKGVAPNRYFLYRPASGRSSA